MAAVVSFLLLAMVFAPATGFTIWEFCFALPAFISWLIGGSTVGFVCLQLEKMYSGKASHLTCSGGQTSFGSVTIATLKLLVPLCPCLHMSSHCPTLTILWVEPLATTCIVATLSIFTIASMIALAPRFFHGS